MKESSEYSTTTEVNSSPQFNTFGGVFTPDVLTILGVIMYLRLGWVVGNTGFLGALAIILLAKTVTICTGLSMSSITTNIRIGAGGAYSIISKSLGLEAGGSIGIPFYISQILSAALYVIGFTEGWLLIFPDVSPMLVSIAVWVVLLMISGISTHFAIRTQYLIMFIIVGSLVSFLATPALPQTHLPLIGEFEDADFWQAFAVFFPAVTGIMAGANMSGDLRDPRKSIPLGTMSAILITLLIYVGLAYFCAWKIPMEELRSNQMVMVEYALYAPLVIAGLLAATFSSALASLIGAPRILQALSEQKTVPFHQIFVKKTAKNEPLNAIIFSALVMLVAIVAGDLNALATLITMFFLVTYGTLNLIVFIEQSIKIPSFRPTFKIPLFVSFWGAFSCFSLMFFINALFSVVAFLVIVGLYSWLSRKELKADWGDIRGGILLALAERASHLADQFPRHQICWKPDLLVPIDNPSVWVSSLSFIRSITYPSGSIFAFTIHTGEKNPEEDKRKKEEIHRELKNLLTPLSAEKILANYTIIEDQDFLHGAKLVIQTLKGAIFRPNALFLTFGKDQTNDPMLQTLVSYARMGQIGTILLHQHPRMAFGMQKNINLWLRDKSPNWHLAVLLALQVHLNWSGQIHLITVAPLGEEERLYQFLEHLSDQARLPFMTEFHVLTGNFEEVLAEAPKVDINILGLGEECDLDLMRKISEKVNSSCLFVADSGHENAFS